MTIAVHIAGSNIDAIGQPNIGYNVVPQCRPGCTIHDADERGTARTGANEHIFHAIIVEIARSHTDFAVELDWSAVGDKGETECAIGVKHLDDGEVADLGSYD